MRSEPYRALLRDLGGGDAVVVTQVYICGK